MSAPDDVGSLWAGIAQGRLREIEQLHARLQQVEAALFTLGSKIAEQCSEGNDIGGGDAQEWLAEAGLLVATTVTEACDPEACRCAEYGFPTTCYRLATRTAATSSTPDDGGAV